MGTFAISFRIHDDAGWAARYDSLVEEIGKCESTWVETTSFALVSSDETLSELEDRLYFGAKLLDTKDLLLAIDVTNDPALLRGKNSYPNTLAALMPRLRHGT